MTIYLIALGGLVAVGIGFYLARNTMWLVSNGIEAEGEIVNLIYKPGSGDRRGTYVPVIRFTDTRGQDIVFKSNYSSSTDLLWHGKSMNVLYDQDNPERAVLNQLFALWMVPAIFVIMGVVAFFASVGSMV